MSDTSRPTPPRLEDKNDLGFGSVVAAQSERRLLNKDGSFNVRRRGLGVLRSQSLYHSALQMTWPKFLWTVTAAYLAINVIFAVLFLASGREALVGAHESQLGGAFGRAFFFSVETFATIGYGEISPVGVMSHMLMVFEALIAVMSQALITGLLFARFSRPTAAILFSENMIVAPHQGGRALMFRITNLRDSQLLDVTARVNCSWMDGANRRFILLELERSSVMFFPLAWTLVHAITPDSPVYGVTEEQMLARNFEFLVTISATDETFAQTVNARSSYKANEMLWGAKFRNIFNPADDEGMLSVDVERIDDVERVPLPLS
jgi:inward rectifier potassium channel